MGHMIGRKVRAQGDRYPSRFDVHIKSVFHIGAETLRALAENAAFYLREAPLPLTGKAAKLLSPEARGYLGQLQGVLAGQDDWSATALESLMREFADSRELKLGAIAQPLRAALTGSTASPGLFEVMAVLGRAECLNRLAAIGEYS